MNSNETSGLWPVMLTPFTDAGDIDYASLERLIDWYERNGATGLFAACQSSEVFFLSLSERVELVRFIKSHAHVPVIASGHTSQSPDSQAEELRRIGDAGAEALILITNRLVPDGDRERSVIPALKALMERLDPELPLGFYECPYPFKRLLTPDELKWCADSGRFAFIKDTCCDIDTIRLRLETVRGSRLALYNANTTTLLPSLRAGAAGFSGVMANFHMDLYRWLLDNWRTESEKAELLQSFLTAFSQIERQLYPVNAKYHLSALEHVISGVHSRAVSAELLTPTFKEEVRQMRAAAEYIKNTLCRN